MSVSKLTNAEARRLLDMTKRSLIAELNFPTRGDEKEFDVVNKNIPRENPTVQVQHWCSY